MIHSGPFRIAMFSAAALVWSALRSHAQNNLNAKLGLWEVTSTNQSSGLPPGLESLPPEQRARVEAMIKAQQAKGGTAHTTKSCLTKDKLDNAFKETDNMSNMSCKRTTLSSTSSMIEFKLECTGDKGRKANGTLHIELPTRETMKGTVKMTMGDEANSMNINVSMTGKWVSDSCGDVK